MPRSNVSISTLRKEPAVVFSQKNGGKRAIQRRENPDIGSSWRWNLGADRWWRVGGSKGAGGRRARENRPPSRSPPVPRGWGWAAGWTHPHLVPEGRGSPHAATGILKVYSWMQHEIFDKFAHYNLKRHNHQRIRIFVDLNSLWWELDKNI